MEYKTKRKYLKPVYELGDQVRHLATGKEYVVTEVVKRLKSEPETHRNDDGSVVTNMINVPTYFYKIGDSGDLFFVEEKEIEMVIPKRMFYLYVNDGKLYPHVLDDEQYNVHGGKAGLAEPWAKIPGTGIELPYKEREAHIKYGVKKKSYKTEENEDPDYYEDDEA